MNLIVAIVNKDDASALTVKLNKSGFMSTKLSTTGGFLKTGNVTFLLGVEDEKVDSCLKIMEECCAKRNQTVNIASGHYAEQFFTSLPVEIPVGGATVFIVDVERFIKM